MEPNKVVFRCRAAHGTFVPHALLDAVDKDPEHVFREFKEKVESAIGVGDARAYFDLAQAYREMGLMEGALEMIDKVLAIEPSWRNAAFIRAELIEELRKR